MIGLVAGSSLLDAWHEVKYKGAAIDRSAAGQNGSRNLRGRDRSQVKHSAEEPEPTRRRNRSRPMRALLSAVQYITSLSIFGPPNPAKTGLKKRPWVICIKLSRGFDRGIRVA